MTTDKQWESAPPALASSRPLVLAVDDVPENLTTIAEIIRTLDVDVRVASSGEAALRYARLEPRPDLVLLDIMMPDMDGHAVLAELRARPETRDMPVIFVTALDRPEDEETGLAEGAADYIAKPIAPTVLKARVQAQLELRRRRQLEAGQKAWLEQEVQRRVAENARLEARLQLALGAAGLGVWEHDHRSGRCQWSDDHEDGHWLWLEARGRAIQRDADGRPLATLGVMTDISRRKAAEAEHRLSAAVFAGISEGLCVTDTGGTILMVNDAFVQVTGYDVDEVLGKTPRISHYVGIFSDLSERKAAAEQIQYLSTFDPLTDLPNRNLFADRLGQALLAARRFERSTAVILLDLDHFRLVNDTLGPPAGDAILVEVARRLSLHVREGDTVGRRSGNEFGFIMASLAEAHDAIALAQRMLDAMAVPFEVAGQPVAVTCTIGVAIAPRDGDTADALLRAADAALVKAKKAARNSFCFYSPEMDADAERRLGLEAGLREALARNEFTLAYQPQISLDTGSLVGAEALLRWQSPRFGAVSPGEFIPIAEETGMILPIGAWVLETACRQTRLWHDLGFSHLRMAVNLSARQFRQTNLRQLVSDTLAATGLPATALELEITESAFIDDVDGAVAQCRALKDLGVKLSLDDFGTGYSSLAYVSRFPFDKLKIDQSFVRDIIENPVNAAIATAAIVMARSLNLSVLAEGVETEAQASFLRGRRCDAIQGYLYSHPLPAAEFEQLLAGHKPLEIALPGSDGQQTLLLVDDEPHMLSSLSRLLRREGYRILTAASPAEAFEILAKHPVEVIVSDQRMPDMSGTEFFARVRQLYPDSIRIILTGYTDLDSVTSAINRGAIAKFLTKPWDDDQLREQIREAFRQAKEVRTQAPVHGND